MPRQHLAERDGGPVVQREPGGFEGTGGHLYRDCCRQTLGIFGAAPPASENDKHLESDLHAQRCETRRLLATRPETLGSVRLPADQRLFGL